MKFDKSIIIYPFLLHSLSMSIFSSVIGPFGGFFASGFKRAFKIKVIFLFSNTSKTAIFHNADLFYNPVGLWRYDSRTWWNYGSIWLSIFNGNICKCIHLKFYTYCIASKASSTGGTNIPLGQYHEYKKIELISIIFFLFCCILEFRFTIWNRSNNFNYTIRFVILFKIEVS